MSGSDNEETCCINIKKKENTNEDSPTEPSLNNDTNENTNSEGKPNNIFGPAFDRAKHWYLGVVGSALAHKKLAERCESRARYLNVTRVILNAIVSSAIFISIGDTESEIDNDRQYILQVSAGSLSILVAILTAVSSTLDYEGRREAHSNAKKAFCKIKHQMEMLLFIKQTPLVVPSNKKDKENEDNEENEKLLLWQDGPKILLDMAPEWLDIVNAWEQVDTESPDVPEKLKKKLRNSQTSILKSLNLLDPTVFSPMVVNKKKSNEDEDEDEYDEDEDEMY